MCKVGSAMKSSWLHFMLRLQPGDLPDWLLSASGCRVDAMGVATGFSGCVLAGVVCVCGLHYWQDRSPVLIGLISMSCGFGTVWLLLTSLEVPRAVERRARSLRRRVVGIRTSSDKN